MVLFSSTENFKVFSYSIASEPTDPNSGSKGSQASSSNTTYPKSAIPTQTGFKEGSSEKKRYLSREGLFQCDCHINPHRNSGSGKSL